MAGWGGFSEEDLHRLKKDHLVSSEPQGREQLEKKTDNLRKANINAGNIRKKPREKIRTKTMALNVRNASEKKNTSENQVQKSQETLENCLEFEAENSTPECERNMVDSEQGENTNSQEKLDSEVCKREETIVDVILEPERIQAIELSALEKMQQKQKEIENQNKLKKAALQETIKSRFKKTQAEAKVLQVVQQELAHLDSLLSADVAVLRDTIDEATRDYHCATKRYERAEAEFVAAKLELHRKTERKELLTEHLYTIIQQNEQRKAKKLEELMAKLNLSEDDVRAETSEQAEHKTENQNSSANENEIEVKDSKIDDNKEVGGAYMKSAGGVNGTENENNKGVSTEMQVQETRNETKNGHKQGNEK